MNEALGMYGRALTSVPGTGGEEDSPAGLEFRFDDGSRLPLRIDRYLAAAVGEDLELLDGLQGPVIDLGCGPGRHLRALTARGVFSLGVDISPSAVSIACTGGGRAIVADVFGQLPGEGNWRSALLLDGNIGIGGCAVTLLRRVRSLLTSDGVALVEVEAPGTRSGATRAKLEQAGASSDWFAWARVSASEISQLAEGADLALDRLWCCEARWFARLAPAAPL